MADFASILLPFHSNSDNNKKHRNKNKNIFNQLSLILFIRFSTNGKRMRWGGGKSGEKEGGGYWSDKQLTQICTSSSSPSLGVIFSTNNFAIIHSFVHSQNNINNNISNKNDNWFGTFLAICLFLRWTFFCFVFFSSPHKNNWGIAEMVLIF